MEEYIEFCTSEYKRIYATEYDKSELKKHHDKRKFAQKRAIKETSVNAMRKFSNVEPSDIWKSIYISHINNFSGITDLDLIQNIISASQSWKKSSGHAFEEMIRDIGNIYLQDHGLKILLQKELSVELKNQNVKNEVRDISWLREQIGTSIFDLFLAIEEEDGYFIYGCVQSKTSIRDRVTRDREPSINAMRAFFISFAICLDGDFLRLPKFQNMVNGNSKEFELNGWHYMYVFSNENVDMDRIKTIDISMDAFVQDSLKGAEFWQTQRQWLNPKWKSK